MLNFNSYADQVVNHIPIDSGNRKQIREDILSRIEEMNLREGYDDPAEIFGEPQELAGKIMTNLGIKPRGPSSKHYEYKSETRILGLPLVHITGGNKVAKGIIAIGGVSIGVISLGGLSFGLFTLGGVSISLLFSLGGFSISLGFAVGGLAMGCLGAVGGLAISKVLAMGGLAIAKDIAIGDTTRATICGYQSSFTGQVGIHMPTEAHLLPRVVQEYFPNLDKIYYTIINLVTQQQ